MDNTTYTSKGAPVWAETVTQAPQFNESNNTINQKIFFPSTINE